MGEREISHCRDLHPTSHVQLVRLHDKGCPSRGIIDRRLTCGLPDLIRDFRELPVALFAVPQDRARTLANVDGEMVNRNHDSGAAARIASPKRSAAASRAWTAASSCANTAARLLRASSTIASKSRR